MTYIEEEQGIVDPLDQTRNLFYALTQMFIFIFQNVVLFLGLAFLSVVTVLYLLFAALGY